MLMTCRDHDHGKSNALTFALSAGSSCHCAVSVDVVMALCNGTIKGEGMGRNSGVISIKEAYHRPEVVQRWLAINFLPGSIPARVSHLARVPPGHFSLPSHHSHSLVLLSVPTLRQSDAHPIMEWEVGQQHCTDKLQCLSACVLTAIASADKQTTAATL